MKKMIRPFVFFGLMVSLFIGVSGCGSSAPQVIGELKDPVALPNYATAWLERVTIGDNTTEADKYYFDANNQLIAWTREKMTPGTTTTSNGSTAEILANTFVRDQEVTMSRITISASGMTFIFYWNCKIVSGNLVINPDNSVIATRSIYTTADNTTGSFTTTTTLTGTLIDENTIKFTNAVIKNDPAKDTHTSDQGQVVDVTWVKQ